MLARLAALLLTGVGCRAGHSDDELSCTQWCVDVQHSLDLGVKQVSIAVRVQLQFTVQPGLQNAVQLIVSRCIKRAPLPMLIIIALYRLPVWLPKFLNELLLTVYLIT